MQVPKFFSKYLHRDPDDYEFWELDEQGEQRFSQKFHDAVHYATYEIEVVMEPQPKTETCEIVAFRDGEKWFIPADPLLQRCLPQASFHSTPHKRCILR